MASPASSKKQIIESIKDKKNILVTVSSNPSVDELSAALGLTIFLNKLDKHATAIASGTIPSALDFLDPEKTFEATADSLRDFIIALDKEKADHLRYKLDGDVVKIFITPYRTTITQKDLEFSQGDYNVELVLALNVAESGDLDKALAAHGKILHDATVATISTGNTKSSLGTLEWHEDTVSGVSEMVTEIIQELKTAKADVDEQIATALLTGIVASTERFSNDMTSSKVMTMSAELMASGANQQLIAAQLQKGEPEPVETVTEQEMRPRKAKKQEEPAPEEEVEVAEEVDPTRLTIDRSEDTDTKSEVVAPGVSDEAGTMNVGHEREGDIDEVAEQVRQESQEEAARAAEAQLNKIAEDAPVPQFEAADKAPQPAMLDEVGVLPPVQPSIAQELEQATEQLTDAPIISKAIASDVMDSPLVGGTLNATTAAAAEQKREEQSSDQNRTILTHNSGPLGAQPVLTSDAPLNAAMAAVADEPPAVDIFAAPPAAVGDALPPSASTVIDPLTPAVDADQLDATPPVQDDSQAALAAVTAALDAPVVEPVVSMGLPSQPAPDTGVPTLADIEAGGMTGLPPMPDFASLPPLPAAPIGVDVNGLPPLPTTQPQEFNPAQFQIPPQE